MASSTVNLKKYLHKASRVFPYIHQGRVQTVVGLVIGANGPMVAMGELCEILVKDKIIRAEVVGFERDKILLMPLGDMSGVAPGAIVQASGEALSISVSNELLGRVVDGLGRPLDNKGPLPAGIRQPVYNTPPNPLVRARINLPLAVGVKAIDGCMTLGKGQRIGIFAGSGVGKSTVLGMMARNTSADINVIALIGERGREVREFIEKDLGAEGLKRSVVVVATSDQPALIRIKGAFIATAIAEFFRDQGRDVLLMMDSVTRFCMAQREVGLSIGEPPTTKGYPPSVFAMLPQLMERAGMSDQGSITGIYTVLVDSDDMNEPIADTSRSILDGHIILDRKIAAKNHWPAINVLHSLSRVMPDVTDPQHRAAAATLRNMMAVYQDAEDLINIGAYAKGSNPAIDRSIKLIGPINDFLCQSVDEKYAFQDIVSALKALVK